MRVAFRVDASHVTGTGHAMRCLALADGAMRAGAETCFVTRMISPPVEQAILDSGHGHVKLDDGAPVNARAPHAEWLGATQRHDAAQTREVLSNATWDWIVVDHYAVGAEWESALRQSARMLVIDDRADRRHECDALLDQNAYLNMQERYHGLVPEDAQLMLGPRYALLRSEFAEWHARATERAGPVARVLIAFGGTDPGNITGQAIKALERIAGLVVDVVVGAGHANREDLETRCGRLGYGCHVQTTRMAELMSVADLAVGAGGITMWERCAVGLPALAFAVAENQRAQVRDAAIQGLVYAPDVDTASVAGVIERHVSMLLENSALRRGISRRGMQLVDGAGVSRVCRRLGWLALDLRPATMADCERLFEWRNHPSIRAVSATRDPIQSDVHRRWLESVLGNRNQLLLIGERDGAAVGVVRFDIEAEEAEVSIYLVPGSGGAGNGSQLLRQAERRLVSERPDVRSCRARVLGDNRPSHGLFASCGYSAQSTWYCKRLSA